MCLCPSLSPVAPHLDHAVEGLCILGPEYLPDVKHVQLTAGDHDADQRVVPSPQALENRWGLGIGCWEEATVLGAPSFVANTNFVIKR